MLSYSISIDRQFEIERGSLHRLEISYAASEDPKATEKPIVLVCPPFTASPKVVDWWPRLFGVGKRFSPTRYCLLCIAPLGSAYGTSGPTSDGPDGTPYCHAFPEVTVRDIARVNLLLLEELHVPSVDLIIGPSLGGMVALEMSIIAPSSVRQMALIGSNAVQSQYLAAYSESQRMIIELDSSWCSDSLEAGREGLKIARSVAILSYRPYSAYAATQQGFDDKTGKHKACSYQHYKGSELARRYNAICYHRLLSAFDSHDVGRGRGGIKSALSQVTAKTVAISLSSDLVFPIHEQRLLADSISNASWKCIETDYGHDGFLIETDQLSSILDDTLTI